MIARFKGATVVRLKLHLYIKYLSPTTIPHTSYPHKLITTVAIYLASQDQITDPNVTLKIDKLLLRYGEREVRSIRTDLSPVLIGFISGQIWPDKDIEWSHQLLPVKMWTVSHGSTRQSNRPSLLESLCA